MQNCVWKKMPKNTSGGPSGDPFWDPKWPQIDVGGTKIAKIFDQKSSWNEFRIPDGPRIASGPFPGGATSFWPRRERFTPHVRGSPRWKLPLTSHIVWDIFIRVRVCCVPCVVMVCVLRVVWFVPSDDHEKHRKQVPKTI